MTEPSAKSNGTEDFLESVSGRTTAIKADRCVPAPIGCGNPVAEFRDKLSYKEYTISGLCQKCQDGVFGG